MPQVKFVKSGENWHVESVAGASELVVKCVVVSTTGTQVGLGEGVCLRANQKQGHIAIRAVLPCPAACL